MRWVKPKVGKAAWHIMAMSVCCTASSLVGCSSAEQATAAEEKSAVAEIGSVNLALTGASASGAVYRLRNALFQITSLYGDYETFVSSEDDPESTFLYLEVPQGEYYVYLLPGYTVEQVSAGNGGGNDTGGTIPVPTASTAIGSTAPVGTVTTVSTQAPAIKGWRGGKLGAARQSSYEQPEPAPYEAGIPDPDPTDTTDSTDATETIDYTDTIDYSDDTVVADGGVETTSPPSQDGGSGEAEVQLISENPAYVYVQAYQVSQVRFSFLVDGDTVNTEPNGGLIIGADFYEEGDVGGTCEGSDPYEPNDFSNPVYVETTYPLYAYMCPSEDDMYQFDAPVPEGEIFVINVTFDSSIIDIDVEYATSDYEYLGGSYGVDDTETLIVTSNGGSYLLYAFPYWGGDGAPYEVTFSAGLDVSNSCCETSEGPFCSDPEVMACVCAIDGNCCGNSYDELCVQEAIAECGAQCELPEPTSSCCEAAAEPGCLDEAVETCVCDIDPSCCTTGFDQNCANLAQGQCGAVCGGD